MRAASRNGLLILAWASAACSGSIMGDPTQKTTVGPDAGVEEPQPDARPADSATSGAPDATPEPGPSDAALPDAPTPDATEPDASLPDEDAGPIDAVVPRELRTGHPPVSIQPGGIAYWDTPYFANAVYNAEFWIPIVGGNWGERIHPWNHPQFAENGLPRYLEPGQSLMLVVYGLHVGAGRSELAEGRVVLTWSGHADVRLNHGATYLESESNGPATGMIRDGRRVYRFDSGHLSSVHVEAMDADDPVTDLKVWLADPADPANRSLEGQLFHPTFLERMRDEDWGVARFMDWLHTNSNPTRDWSDRRLPTHAFMTGRLNPRAPAQGFAGNRGTGVAYEMLVQLCNEVGLDLWINVPHLATDDHVAKLARLIRFGSDGVEPYAGPVSNPVYPPLAPHLRVYVEYSNEIWSWGDSFAQGNWAYDQAQSRGITKEQFNARRFCEVFSIFQDVFDGPDRLVRVAAVFTGSQGMTEAFLDEMAAYCPTTSPPAEPDVVSPTTYFGNGIQDYVFDQAWLDGISESYWTSSNHAAHVDAAFDEWTRRILSGDAQEGAGPDATGVGGGFGEWLHEAAQTTFGSPKPLVAYEGGPSIYTNELEDRDSVKGPAVTRFMGAMNRHARMSDVYRAHLHMAHSRGLTTHAPFVLVSSWSKWGQWGHLESLDQDPNAAVKYRFVRDWIDEVATLRHIDHPLGSTPRFSTAHHLEPALIGSSYQATVQADGGDGVVAFEIVATHLVDGLSVVDSSSSDEQFQITGTPQGDQTSYVYVMARDDDGDTKHRTFVIRAVGGPGTIVESDFGGADPALNTPWTQTYVTAPSTDFSGWELGAGLRGTSGENALLFDCPSPSDEGSLQRALDEDQYLSATLSSSNGLDLRGGEIQLGIRRFSYHAPRRYAVFTSIGGFGAGQEIFTTPHTGSMSDLEHRITLPSSAAYQLGSGVDVEIRIYPYAGQYANHPSSLSAFKLSVAP